MKFFKTKYRIVEDRCAGYEAQCKYWWMPFWLQIGGVNTSPTIEKAERICKGNARRFVKNVEV